MEVSVTLFGGLRQYLPAGSGFNKCRIALDPGASLETLLQKVPIPPDKPYMVLLNDEKITSERYSDITIEAQDLVILLPPIKGG